MIDWKVSVGAILVVLLGAWLAHRLSASRDRSNAYKAKALEFQELLAPFLRTLEATDAHPTTLVIGSFQQHDEAARKLRLYMSKRKKRRFDERWRAYESLYRKKQTQGILGQIATEVDDLSMASLAQPGA